MLDGESRVLVSCEVRCSSGTYVRVLAADIGDKLGCGAHIVKLRRTEIGKCDESLAHDMNKILADGAAAITFCPPEQWLSGMRYWDLKPTDVRSVYAAHQASSLSLPLDTAAQLPLTPDGWWFLRHKRRLFGFILVKEGQVRHRYLPSPHSRATRTDTAVDSQASESRPTPAVTTG